MDTFIKNYFDDNGLTASSASKKSGIPYITIRQHILGKRKISPILAVQYEKSLGIPRSELRPDLWPPERENALQKQE